MNSMFDRFLYGGDYNPNQWPSNVWEEDLRLFDQAGINSATINVFSWAKLQPSEDEYCFDELDQVVAMLRGQDISIVMGTATAALPAWMFMRYPEVARVDYEGRRHKFGRRHNACPNSLVYRQYAARLADKLAQRYGQAGQVSCWHVNNEYGGICYCETCEKAFRVWLKNKYGTLAALNKAWNFEFWGHLVHSWDEIVAPNALGDGIGPDKTAFAGLSIDYMRFNSDSLLANFILERDAIRRHDPVTPITTNMMGTYKQLDYFKWAREMDVVSWDSYPAYDTPWSMVAMRHDLMRGLKRQPFMLMEQTPSQQNWQPFNSLKRPGQMRAQSWQSVARGADTIQFFQLRRSVGGCEKFHGAVISHAGTADTRVFREVSQLGRELKAVGGSLLGAANPAQVALLFDWDNYWALEYTSGPSVDLRYVEQIHHHYRALYERNIPVDLVSPHDDLSPYRLVLAPVLYMVKDDVAKALSGYVQAGGVLLTGYMSGLVDQSDNVHLGGYPGPLRKLAGLWVEEIDALAPEQKNSVEFEGGARFGSRLLCDLIRLEGAQALATYGQDFYAGSPAITHNRHGKGQVFYLGTMLEQDGLRHLMDLVVSAAGLSLLPGEKTGLEIVCRETDSRRFWFVMNFQQEELPLPARFAGQRDLLTGAALGPDTQLRPFDVFLIGTDKT